MARIIIRTAMHEGAPGATQEAIRKHLRDECGYEIAGRATVEGNGSVPELIGHLRRVLDILENPPGGGVLDHLWVYLDTPDYEPDEAELAELM